VPEVTTLGILVADVLGRPIDSLPERGQLASVEEMTLGIGGCAANTGIDLARLGVETAVIGKVGDDGFGDFVTNALIAGGVDSSGVRRDPSAHTSATMVIIHSDGERTFLHHCGANATIRPEDVDMDIVASSRILHIAGSFLMPGFDGEPAAEVLKAARALGVRTSLDTAFDFSGQWMKLMRPMLDHVDYFVPSYDEAKEMVGYDDPKDIAKAFLDFGIETVCLKMGGRGSYGIGPEGEVTVPIFRVEPVDATGAGDAFAAGFLCGVVKGWDLERCVTMGNAVGALCVSAIGATTGTKSLAETLAFIESRVPA
jgi:sugar/nucleoside kinase (ribokinase family)